MKSLKLQWVAIFLLAGVVIYQGILLRDCRPTVQPTAATNDDSVSAIPSAPVPKIQNGAATDSKTTAVVSGTLMTVDGSFSYHGPEVVTSPRKDCWAVLFTDNGKGGNLITSTTNVTVTKDGGTKNLLRFVAEGLPPRGGYIKISCGQPNIKEVDFVLAKLNDPTSR